MEACEPVSVMLGGRAFSEGEGSMSKSMEDIYLCAMVSGLGGRGG